MSMMENMHRFAPTPRKIDITEDGEPVMQVDYLTDDWSDAVKWAKQKNATIRNVDGIYQVLFIEVWGIFEYERVMRCHYAAANENGSELDHGGPSPW